MSPTQFFRAFLAPPSYFHSPTPWRSGSARGNRLAQKGVQCCCDLPIRGGQTQGSWGLLFISNESWPGSWNITRVLLSLANTRSHNLSFEFGSWRSSEGGWKFYTEHDSARHLPMTIKVTLSGHCIRSWQHQSRLFLVAKTCGAAPPRRINKYYLKPGPLIALSLKNLPL